MSPSLFILGWMALVSCVLRTRSGDEAFVVLVSVVASLVAMMSEAGAMESGEPGSSRALRLGALVAFLARLVAFAVGARG
jgi:hypothetical protein